MMCSRPFSYLLLVFVSCSHSFTAPFAPPIIDTPSVADAKSPSLADFKGSLLRKSSEFRILQREQFADVNQNRFTDKDQRLTELRDECIALCETIATISPPTAPFINWMNPATRPSSNPLDGRWALRFTTAPDATFKPSLKLGNATTTQTVDSKLGTFTNEIDFDGSGTSKLLGLRVIVDGRPVEGTNEVQLKFRKVTLLRRSRFPRLFGTLSARIPTISSLSALARLFRVNGGLRTRRPTKTILFVDDNMRIHKSSTGAYFVQSKVIRTLVISRRWERSRRKTATNFVVIPQLPPPT